jgi:biopolymer transport protein TolQ
MQVSSIDAYTGGILGMLYSAGPVAKAVVLILCLFSIVCWTIIFLKFRQYKKTDRDGQIFMKGVKESDSFKKLITLYRENPENSYYRLVLASYKEIASRQKENPTLRPDTLAIVENVLKITVAEESERLERRLSFLATTANAAPFIGLFGTVWGIMDSFREIGVRGTTSLAVVAPGISEALIATAIGLATAIPAVLAYNYFVGRLKRILSRMDNASMHIINILEK